MWTENVTWFSNEEGKKGRIAVGQLADLTVPDRDFLACPEDAIADITAVITVVGGRIVYGADEFARYDETPPPPAMPTWSPVRSFGGYGAWRDSKGESNTSRVRRDMSACGCAHHCNVHGHDHIKARRGSIPARDMKSFWGALGCSCWAV
jgi:hypothetical protein